MRARLQAGVLAMASILPLTDSAAEVDIGGAFLGVHAAIRPDDEEPTDPQRRGFDFAGNVDVEWTIADRLTGIIQIQGGTGASALGFVGPELAFTDINVRYSFDKPAFVLTFGSFDTPFGEQTEDLTNNGDASRNPFFLNSLFYSAFAGTPTGTLNTLGAMGVFSVAGADFRFAFTNGTDETANNGEGNYDVVASAGWTPPGIDGARIAGSFMRSDDREPNLASGFAADFSGWMLDGAFTRGESHARGYLGKVNWGDETGGTADGVLVWMGEVRIGIGNWHLAGRTSSWEPDDDDGDGSGISTVLPNPGLGNPLVVDQRVRRHQIGLGWRAVPNVTLKGEVVLDEYRETTAGRSDDLLGFIAGANVGF